MMKFLSNFDRLNASDRMFDEIFNFVPGSISKPRECCGSTPVIVKHAELSCFSDFCEAPKVVFVTDLIRLELLVKKRGIIAVVTTSELQSRILQHVLNVPTFTAEEPIDTLYSSHFYDSDRISKHKNICFYGYSNSIERTSSHLAFPLNEVSLSSPGEIKLHLFSDKMPPSFKRSKMFSFSHFGNLPSFAKKNFGYVVLSDIPVDLSVATLAKSPNKLLSSFQLGLLPIVPEGSYLASKLPANYPLKFDSVSALCLSLMSNLKPERDSKYLDEIKTELISSHLSSYTRNQSVLKQFLSSLDVNQRVRHQDLWPNKSFYSIKDSLNALKHAVQIRFFN